MIQKSHIIYKKIGETPLEALELFRSEQIAVGRVEFQDISITYAGRLDPMAEGKLLLLVGDECKKKEEYLGLDKEYEVEIIFGIETDTYDSLGLSKIRPWTRIVNDTEPLLSRYVGKFWQEYPAYSSKTIEGLPLHSLARDGGLPKEMPTKEVEIYSIKKLGIINISAIELKKQIVDKVSLVKGDFRQNEIITRWSETLVDPNKSFEILKIRVTCSGGTYMRSLAHRIGQDQGCGAFALSIKRTNIGEISRSHLGGEASITSI